MNNMANQINTTVTVIAQEGQSVTVNSPNGQQVTVSGRGQFSITFTENAVNVIPMDQYDVEQEVEPLPLPEVVAEVPIPVVEFRQWWAAQPGSFYHSMDTLANSGKQSSGQFSRGECVNLVSLKIMNLNAYNRIFERMNLPAREKTNLQARIWRLEKPELVRACNQRQRERYHRQIRERRLAMV